MGRVASRYLVDGGSGLQVGVACGRQKLRSWPAGEGGLTQQWQLKSPSLACVQRHLTRFKVAETGID